MILALLLTLASPAHAGDYSTPDQVLARFQDEPDIRQVQQMVLDYSKTDPHYVDAWLKAAKDTYLLPEFQATGSYGEGKDLSDDYVVDPNNPTGDPYLEPNSTGASTDWKVELRAKWSLEKVVMSSENIRVINEAQDIVKLRDKILEEVTRTYFDRRRLQVDMLLNPGDVKNQLKNELRLEELTAQLDAYTGGRFSAALKKGQ
jgi:hypothetical protein